MDLRMLTRLKGETAVDEGEEELGEQEWVTAHPACARRKVRMARTLRSPKVAGALIYLYPPGE
jgi:hypothetical protein